MSKYMFAAAMCDITVASTGPIKVNERAIVAPSLVRRRAEEAEAASASASASASQPQQQKQQQQQQQQQRQAPAQPDEAGNDAGNEDDDGGGGGGGARNTPPTEEEQVLRLKEGGYHGVRRYDEVGGARVREKAQALSRERAQLRGRHEEAERELATQYKAEADVVATAETERAELRRGELEGFLDEKKKQRELAAQEAAQEEVQAQTRHRIHPIDILQSQIAMNLAAERQQEVWLGEEFFFWGGGMCFLFWGGGVVVVVVFVCADGGRSGEKLCLS